MEAIHKFLDQHLTEEWHAIFLVVGAVVLGYLIHGLLASMVRLTGRTKTSLDEELVTSQQGPIVQVVVLFGVYLAVGRIGLAESLVTPLQRVLLSLGLITVAISVLRITRILLTWAASRADRLPLIEKRTIPLFQNLTFLIIVGLGLYGALIIWKVDPTAWLASAGVLGLAFGLAAKDTLGNLFSGVFIVADAPYQLGDYIVLDNGDRGMVNHIGLRSTRIQTRDDVQVTIPNSVIAASKIINQSGGGATHMRVRTMVGVHYDSDIDLVRMTLTQIGAEEELLLEHPAPRVRFRTLGDSGLNFELLGWVTDPTKKGQAIDSMNTQIIERFREAGIEIPYPQQVVHLHNADKS